MTAIGRTGGEGAGTASSAGIDARVSEVLFARERARIEASNSDDFRLVYYTTGDVAVKIITEQKVWLRNTLVMNDFSEIDYGMHCLMNAIQAHAPEWEDCLEAIHVGLFKEVTNAVDDAQFAIKSDTFILCMSEHHKREDDHGRLSMWRAYGRSNGVAIVIKPQKVLTSGNLLGATSIPVSYRSLDEFASEFHEMIKGLRHHKALCSSMDRGLLVRHITQRFRFFMLATKHPGFAEELEWRVVASPTLWDTKYLEKSVEVVGGTPQSVIKLRLRDDVDSGLVGLDPSTLMERIIVGPCAFPFVTCEALSNLLQKHIPAASIGVFASQIPLRVQ